MSDKKPTLLERLLRKESTKDPMAVGIPRLGVLQQQQERIDRIEEVEEEAHEEVQEVVKQENNAKVDQPRQRFYKRAMEWCKRHRVIIFEVSMFLSAATVAEAAASMWLSFESCSLVDTKVKEALRITWFVLTSVTLSTYMACACRRHTMWIDRK